MSTPTEDPPLTDQPLLFLALAAPFLAALIAAPATAYLGRAGAILLAAIPAALALGFAAMVPTVADGARITASADWLPGFSVRLAFLVDGLSLLFALLITGIGALIVLYAGGYMKGHPHAGRFMVFLFLFMGSMLGLVLADDGITLFVFWEATSLTSFLLIGFDNTRAASRRAALQALVITGAGGLCLLAAVLLGGAITGTRNLSGWNAAGDAIRDSALYWPMLLLVLGAAFTKSAQMPLHVWLPNAMEAPTPVSAYLHSATMVKAGVYLLLRLHPSLGDTVPWTTILPLFGGVTLVLGALIAMRQSDLKLMLAWTTVASLGLLVMLTGIGTEGAIAGAVAYLLAHALFKGALFMVAGAIDHETGTRDVTRLGGLRSAMPITFAAALVGAISMGGLPPMLGFVAKEGLYLGLVDDGAFGALAIATIGSALMLATAFQVALKPFVGPPVETPRHAHEAPFELFVGPAVLGVASLLAGLAAGTVAFLLIEPAASAALGAPVHADLHLVPTYISAPLVLSLVTIAAGALLYRLSTQIRAGVAAALAAIGWTVDRGFDQAIAGLLAFATVVTRTFQTGEMNRYVTVAIAATAAALILPLVLFGEAPALPAFPDLAFHQAAIVLLTIGGLAAVLVARTRLTAIVSLGIQGFGVAVIYLLAGAPDLSFTQFMVETLAVVILTLAMTRLSLAERDTSTRARTAANAVLAIAVGGGFTAVLLAVVAVPFDRRLTDFFDAYARTIAHGRNIVNVIIVDFRGLDTLGEIVVVTITGLCILALLRVKARRRLFGPQGGAGP